MQKESCRRGRKRIEFNTRAKIHRLNDELEFEGYVANISAEGLKIIGIVDPKGCLEDGHEVEVRFFFESLENEDGFEEISVKGLIRHIGENDGNISIGIQALDERERLQKLQNTWLTLMFEILE